MRRFMLAAAAGAMTLGATSFAQFDRSDERRSEPSFVSTDTILDAKVGARSERESTADIEDLVVDTRNGRAVYAIIDTNGILGSDDKTVAIPYGALSWNPGKRQFRLDVTADQLRGLPECNPKDLARLHDQSWFSMLRGIFGEQPELRDAAEMRGDEYTWRFTQTRPMSLEGEIIAVKREARTARGGSYHAVVIDQGDSGGQSTILLAPLAHLSRESSVPVEGNQVTVTAIRAIDADGRDVYVAHTLQTDSKTLRLRDNRGVPAWPATDRSFYTLASSLDDGSLHARGEEFGSVDQIVFDVHSGTAAFAIISVGGVLGVADTLYPVPCDMFAMGSENNLYIDMPVSKLELAPKLSGDGIQDLNNQQFARSVWGYFEMKPKSFETARPERWQARP